MIKVDCPSCSAPYELDERRLPKSGLKMRCPKCGASFRVHPSGETEMAGAAASPAAAPKRAPKKTQIGVGVGPAVAPPPPPPPAPPDGGVDLPAAKGPSGPAFPGPGARSGKATPAVPFPSAQKKTPARPFPAAEADGGVDLPAPKRAPLAPAFPGAKNGVKDGGVDLPAPKRKPPVAPPFPSAKKTPPAPFPGGRPDGGVDLPAPKGKRPPPPGGVDLPAPKGAPRPPPPLGEVDLPAPKGAPRRPPPMGGVDLPAPKGAPRPPAPPMGGVDLPAPKGAPRPPSGVDLPAPKGAIPTAAGAVDLPAPKGGVSGTPFDELDLPTPKGGGGGMDLDLPAPRGAQPSVDLPAPVGGTDLPAPKGGGAGFADLDLPTPKAGGGGGFGELDLPMAKGNVDLPAPQGMADLPAPHGATDLPAPRGVDELDLPIPVDSQQLPAPAHAHAHADVGAFGDLELPMPPSMPPHGSDPDAQLPVPAGDVELPRPMRRGGSPDELELPTPNLGGGGALPVPGGAPAGPPDDLMDDEPERGAVGGVEFGELDLGEGDDSMEFGDIPQERDSLTGRAPVQDGMGVSKSTIGVASEAAAETRERQRARIAAELGKEDEDKPKRSLLPWAIAGVVLILVGGAAALSFTPYGFFGIYWLEQFLPEAGDDASAGQIIDAAEQTASTDTYLDVRASLTQLAEGRNQMGLNRRLLARSLLHECLYQVRFGEDPASAGRATRILARLDQRGSDAPGLHLARAAEALARGAPQEVGGYLSAARNEGTDAYLFLVEGELALRQNDPAAAATAFTAAVEAGAGARGQWGLARALLRGEEPASAREPIAATLAASPRHAGALAARARTLYEDGELVEALQLARSAAGARELEGERLRPSLSERGAAWTVVGLVQERRGSRVSAREAYEHALEADPFNIEALIGAGRVLLSDERHRDSLTHFEAVMAQAEAAAAMPAGEDRSILVEAQIGASRAMIELDRVQDAKSILEVLAQERPEDPEIALWLGKSHEALDDRAAAEQHYRDCIQIAPAHFDGYLALAQLFFKQDRHDEGATVLAQARERVEETAYVRRMLGELELERNNNEQAVTEFRRALELDENDLPARFGLGQALRRSGQLDEADNAFVVVAETDATWPGLALARGRVFEARGDSNMAINSYRRALEERPNDPDLLLRLGAALVSGGRVDEAEDTLQMVLEERPNSAEAEHFIGRVEFARGNLPTALTHFSRAVTLDASKAEFQLYVGWAALEMGNLARALEGVENALERDPSLGDAYWIRGRVRTRTGAVRDALEDLERALELKPGRHEAHAAMGECYDQLGRRPDAIRSYQQALEADNSRGDWWFELGRLQINDGRRGEASGSLERACTIGEETNPRPGWLAEAHRVLGDVLRLGGSRQAAVGHYERFLELAPPTHIDRNEVRDHLHDLGASPRR